MVQPLTTGEPRGVRIRIRCSDEREFQERFAPWYAADGILLPGDISAPVGTALQVIIELRDGRRVLSGTARIESKVEVPPGTQLRIQRVDPGSVPLAPVLAPVGRSAPDAGDPPPRTPARLSEVLFADLPAPEEFAASRPLEVRSSPIKLRLQPTPRPGNPPESD